MDELPIHLSQASGLPFYRQIVDQLASLIRSGQLPPDTRLPSFRELAPRLLVSLITVRRAYAELEAAGLVVCRQGQGTFVADAIESHSRKDALAEARELVASALLRARQLGLRGEALRAHLGRLTDGAQDAATRTEKGRTHGRD